VSLLKEDKIKIVKKLNEVASSAVSVVGVDFSGVSVNEITKLRTDARNQGLYLQIVRNTLVKRAVSGTGFECISDSLQGPIMLAFSMSEPSAPARLFKDFAKKNESIQVKVLALSGQLCDVSDMEKIASLPTKDEAISRLMSVMQAPVVKLARTLKETYTGLARVISAVADKKKEE
tara:strand:- start:45534 stop:46061 length:528 start_codon:yes stop_codon:yes gene_type:complete